MLVVLGRFLGLALLIGYSSGARSVFSQEEGSDARAEQFNAVWASSWTSFRGALRRQHALGKVALGPPNLPSLWKKVLGAGTLVGQGSSGKVFLAPLRCCGSGTAAGSCPLSSVPDTQVAVKHSDWKIGWEEREFLGVAGAIKLQRAKQAVIMNELSLMKNVLTGPIFPKLLAAEHDDSKSEAWMVMEAADSDFGTVVADKTVPLALRARYFAEAMSGVQEIHRLGYIHRDLKPQNALIVNSAEGGDHHAIVADFGLTSKEDVKPDVVGGTATYLAPEVWENEAYSQKQDVWAMGVTFYQTVFGDLPEVLRGVGRYDVQDALRDFDISQDTSFKELEDSLVFRDLPDGLDKRRLAVLVRGLLLQTLEPNPESRITAAEANEKATKIAQMLSGEGLAKDSLLNRAYSGNYCPEIFNRF